MQNAHIICYSGGEASALTAIEVSRKYGTESLVLLNHDMNARIEEIENDRGHE